MYTYNLISIIMAFAELLSYDVIVQSCALVELKNIFDADFLSHTCIILYMSNLLSELNLDSAKK
jgi:hypothetical protein